MDGNAAADDGSTLRSSDAAPERDARHHRQAAPADIAIVGMSAIMPGATDIRRYFENILDKVVAVTEIPADRWPADRYFDGDRAAPDKISSKWGGFLPDIPFDPTRFGIPPAAVPSIDPAQLLALVAAEAALADADLTEIDVELRRRASVILGFTGGLGELGLQYAARAELSRALPETPPETLDFLPRWTSDSFAGLLPNVIAGRIANRFDFGGSNFVVDAACATSLAALRQAVMELESGRSDLVLCGAVEAGQGPFAFTCFSKAQALSPSGRCRSFDIAADGTAIAEGVAMLVLRRLEDARAAGARIYAVIRGIEGSSDGRARGLMAPLPEGQARALRRTYRQAGYSPATVDLIEAHGTGTVAGDAAEIESLSTVLIAHEAAPRSIAVGSVKTLIGHAEGAAGMAGLIKVVLGLHHRVLPPHAGVETPNRALGRADCPIALHQEARPWLPRPGLPRRAGVSAFGFGGANFHVTLEEADRGALASRDRWPVELFVWRTADRAALAASASTTLAALQAGAMAPLGAIARALTLELGTGPATLAIVARSHAALASLLADGLERLRAGHADAALPPGLYLSDTPLSQDGRVAMLFPGQGSQYPDMGRELATTFAEIGTALAEADAVLAETATYRGRTDARLSRLVYPFDRFGEAEEAAARLRLAQTDVAQPALGAIELGLLALMARLGIEPAMLAGHSYGEYVALHAAGVLDRRDLLRVSEARGRAIVGATRDGDLGTMAAVAADAVAVRDALGATSGVVIANLNAPNQTVISGARAAIAAAVERLAAAKIAATMIPVSAAFHSPLMQPAQAPLARAFTQMTWSAPRLPVYANTTAAPHAADPAAVRELMERHLTAPVDFVGTIEAMYAAGARVFLEVGPKTVLTSLTRRILGARPHCAVALEGGGSGLAGLLHAVAALMVQGVQIDLPRLFDGRDITTIALADLGRPPQPMDRQRVWLVNGSRARRLDAQVQTAVAPAVTMDAAGRNAIKPERPARRRQPKEVGMHGYNGPVRYDEQEPDDAADAGVDRVMREHHQTMQQFLRMQERLMLAYLGGGEQKATSEPRLARPFSTPRPMQVLRSPASVATAAVVRPAPPAARPSVAATNPAKPAITPTVGAPAAQTTVSADPKALLLGIASERTGYPEDMLGLDLDMEADLGIDSIKRVEILGAFRKAQPEALSSHLQPHMEHIAKARTLQEVLDRLDAAAREPDGVARPFDEAGQVQDAAALARYVMQPEAEDLPPGPAAVAPGVYLVVQDRVGVTAALTAMLERDGALVRVMPDGVADDDTALAAWLQDVRASGSIRGLVSLASILPHAPTPPDLDAWREGMERSVKALFALLRFAAPDLAAGGIVTVASAMGGMFARDALLRPERAGVFPGAGGGVGLVKTLAMEWPGCRCKAVDLDGAEAPELLAAHLHAEIAAPTGRREVGYPAGRRTIFRTTLAPLPASPTAAHGPAADWVVLAIGGARGITAETLRPFAAVGATCVVVGRNALPEPEPFATVPLTDASALRTHFLAEAKAAGLRPTPAKIESRIAAILRDREIRANMRDLAQLGATIDYRLADVCRESDVAALLDAVYARYDRIDAVLFGAGLIEDRLIVDKTRESLDRVFDTKVDGAFHLARHLRPETLAFLALFSSVAGRYGNRGQADYAAANEVLNRFAWQLQARYGTRTKVVSVNWGAWACTTNGPGMLTAETARQFRERGLKLIEPSEGRNFLLDELLRAPGDQVEVIAGEHDWDAYEDAAGRAIIAPAPSERRVA